MPAAAPQAQGAVEKGIGYLTQSWWRTAQVASVEAVQASANRWCCEVADARVRCVDGAVLTVVEAAASESLLALPAVAFAVTVTLNRAVSTNALVSVWGNRYSVPPDLASASVVVTHRSGTDLIAVHTSGRWHAATHRLAPSGAHRTVRHPEHAEALQAAVLAAFSSPGPCRIKTNRPPRSRAAAIAARLSPHIGARGASAWGDIFRDATIAAAMLDRLLHRCAVINITGDSYRLRAHQAGNQRHTTTTITPPRGGSGCHSRCPYWRNRRLRGGSRWRVQICC